jgi:hypothetical protein
LTRSGKCIVGGSTVTDWITRPTKEFRVKPLAALLGIVMGSLVAMFGGLAMTLAVYLLLPEYHDRLAGERAPLLGAVAWTACLSAVAALAFIGEIRDRRWKRVAQLALAVLLVAFAATYWPK